MSLFDCHRRVQSSSLKPEIRSDDRREPPSRGSAPGVEAAFHAVGNATAKAKPPIPGTEKCSPVVNPINGNLVVPSQILIALVA